MMRSSSKFTKFLNTVVILSIAVNFFIPVYVLLADFSEDKDVLLNVSDDALTTEPILGAVIACLDPPRVSPVDGGSRVKEEQRLLGTITKVQTKCDHLELPGKSHHAQATERQDLRRNSYVCVGGRTGLKKYDCLVYSFGIKHRWEKFPELVEKHLGCRVHVFDPALDYIDHYYTKNVRFFNARLSNIDQDEQHNVPGEKGWKYRRFLTLIKEIHLIDDQVDHMRLDITLDLWRGLSTMLKDGSLVTYVKQLSLEYDLNRKNATEVREMFVLAQWLNKQGFLLANSQPTKLSGKSFSLTYINTKMGVSLSYGGAASK